MARSPSCMVRRCRKSSRRSPACWPTAKSTSQLFNSELIVRTEGTRQVRREVKVYNLDMVLAVGYRSTSPRVVQFRQWATGVPREHLVKGFAMDDDKLRASDGWDYLNHSPPHRSGSFNPLLSR